MNPSIVPASDGPTVAFAARELSRYLRLAGGRSLPVVRPQKDGGRPPTGRVFRIGLCGDVGVSPPAGVTDADDWIRVRTGDSECLITGSNPRSVLFATYRYLQARGFRWIRPGSRGRIVPRLASAWGGEVDIDERASSRYRTVCIAGSASRRHVLDLVDWMAKQGMNGYFLQFHDGASFFRTWHERRHGSATPPPSAEGIVADLVAALRLRGMRFERMGHGWTSDVVGIPLEGWRPADQVPPARRRWLAQVAGKREVWRGQPVNTNLCYSRAQVRAALADAVVAYARAHPEADALHFWLADGQNNHCECPTCRRARPADFYMDILNQLDQRLSQAGLATRIVFLLYTDLLWPPLRARIRNPERFELMFAPITRSFRHSFLQAPDSGERATPYRRNRLDMPRSPAANLAYLRAWRRCFRGPGFDFDYHAIWPCYYDPAGFTIARVLHRDIRDFPRLGLEGLNSAQNQRMSYPHNLLMDVMARTLWRGGVSFRRIVDESFSDAFGPDGGAVAACLAEVSRLWEPFFEPVHIPKPDRARIALGRRRWPDLLAQVEVLRSLVGRNRDRHVGAVGWSWTYLGRHLELLDRLLPMFQAYLACAAGTRTRFEAVCRWLRRSEGMLHPVLDAAAMEQVLLWRVNEVEERLKAEGAGPA